MGYNKNIRERKHKQGERALRKLQILRHLPPRIKTHPVKPIIIPTLDYPPIPTHTLSNNQWIQLERTLNKARRWTLNQKHPYTLTTPEIHDITDTLPLNIRLHQQTQILCDKLQLHNFEHWTQLMENHNIRNFHRHFPSSISKLQTLPEPLYT